MAKTTDRRQFLAQVGGYVAAGATLLALPACELAGLSEEDDFGMHGPIRVNEALLRLPAAESAMGLFAPYDHGEPFLRRWAVAHVARGKRDQIMLMLVDTETGGHAELEIFRRDTDVNPIAHTRLYGIFVDNDGRGDVPTPLHLRKLAERIAEVISENEDTVRLDWSLPTMRQAAPARYPELREGSRDLEQQACLEEEAGTSGAGALEGL